MLLSSSFLLLGGGAVPCQDQVRAPQNWPIACANFLAEPVDETLLEGALLEGDSFESRLYEPEAAATAQPGKASEGAIGNLSAETPASDTASELLNQTDKSEKRPAARTIDILVPALIDDRYLGDVGLQISGDMVTIDTEKLVALLRPEVTAPTLEALIARSQGQSRITPATASGENLNVRFNPQLQQIEIGIPASAREQRTISLSSDFQTVKTAGEEKPESFSFFASTIFSPEYDWKGPDKGWNRLSGQLNLGARIGGIKGVALLSRHSYNLNGAGPKFTRDETALIYDDVRRMLRITAGDLVSRGTGFQSVPLMAGVSVERLFSLQPERLFRPIGNSSFQLDETATVQVRINGVVQRELVLQPGRYNLRDLPLTQGSNLIDLVIRDGTGREIILSDRNFFDFELLAPGITEFSVAAGTRSGLGNRAPTYSDDPLISGFARRGLSENVTAGIDIQADQRGANGGVSVLWAAPVGVFRLQAAGSTRRGFGGGAAFELGYRAAGNFGGGKTRFNLDLRAEHRTAQFTTIADFIAAGSAPVNQPTATSFNLSGQIFTGPVTISASGSYSIGRAGRANTSAAVAGATYQISQRWSVGFFGRYIDDGVKADKGAFLQLVWRPSQNTDVRARYDTIDRESQLSFRSTPSRTVGSLSYGINNRQNYDTDNGTTTADAFYIGNRFEAGLTHTINTQGGVTNIQDQRTRLALGTSLAFAGGNLAIGRPIRDSFAIVKRHQSLQKNPVTIDQTERGYTAKTDILGPALVTELSGYSSRSIYYSVDDLPPGYDLGTGQFVLRPPLNAGYALTVGTDASYSLIGSVKQDGKGAAYIGGMLYSLDDPSAKPIPAFTNRNGRLVATGIKAGRYRLELATTPAISREITISDGPQQLIDIGVIEVVQK
jgi:outer membrane usher protein